MHAVDLHKTPYWSDYQTNEQYFGLLSFDPGDEKSICYVDGDISEWKDSHIVCKNKNMSLSMMYDEQVHTTFSYINPGSILKRTRYTFPSIRHPKPEVIIV